jgi:hypothetical protein
VHDIKNCFKKDIKTQKGKHAPIRSPPPLTKSTNPATMAKNTKAIKDFNNDIEGSAKHQRQLTRFQNLQLNESAQAKVDIRAKAIRGPMGFAWNRCPTAPYANTGRIKMIHAHTWCACGVGHFCEEGLVSEEKSLMGEWMHRSFGEALSVTQHTQRHTSNGLKEDIAVTMALWERIMPGTSSVLWSHHTLHWKTDRIPLPSVWGYLTERVMSRLSRSVHDRCNPERNIVNNYVLTQASIVVSSMFAKEISRGLDDQMATKYAPSAQRTDPEVKTAVILPTESSTTNSMSRQLTDNEVVSIRQALPKEMISKANSSIITSIGNARIRTVLYRTLTKEKKDHIISMHSTCFYDHVQHGVKLAKIHHWATLSSDTKERFPLAFVELFEIEKRSCPRIDRTKGSMAWCAPEELGDLVALGTRPDVPAETFEYIINPEVIARFFFFPVCVILTQKTTHKL